MILAIAAERAFWGVTSLSGGLAVLALLAIYFSMPSPRRALTPPPTNHVGHTYTCYCWSAPVRVAFQPDPAPATRRGRHARPDRPPQTSGVRPNTPPNVGADTGEGERPPVPVAA